MNQASILWKQLREHGLVDDDLPIEAEVDSPWYVKTLLAICGWLAAIFIFSFLAIGIHDLLDSMSGCLIVGSLMLILAWKLLRGPHSDFLEHLALAVSLAGQSILIYALFVLVDLNDVHAWASIFLLQMLLALVMPNFVHRVYSACFAAFAFAGCLAELHITPVASGILIFVTAWLWLNEYRFPKLHSLVTPIGYGLTLALIVMKGSAAFHHGFVWWYATPVLLDWWLQPWVGEVLHTAVMTYVCWQLLQKNGVDIKQPVFFLSLMAILLLCLFSIQAQGLTLGLMILLLGFSGSNRVLQALGILSLLFYLSTYYYLLNTSLLEKSQTLMLIGLLLLALRYLMRHLKVLNYEN